LARNLFNLEPREQPLTHLRIRQIWGDREEPPRPYIQYQR
jgi:hypothetical protein